MKWKNYEKKWQKMWEENKVFEEDPSENSKKFFITVPYPYTSGALHIGHGRTYTIGDVIARFLRTQGYQVLFPMAFHISGAPILSISDKIAKGDEKTIKLYKQYVSIYEKDPKKIDELIEKFKDPKEVANYFASKISQDFKSIGYGIDWRRKFNTGEKVYNSFVVWQYHKLKEMGYLVRDKHAVIFSKDEMQPVGEDDIVDGDVDKVSIVEFVSIKLKFEDGFIIASTLRPETIFGVVNLWVNPDAMYVKAKYGDEIWYLSKEAAEKLKFQGKELEILEELQGSYFVNKTAVMPLVDREIPILPAKFVDPDNASGFVYSVPAHAPYDYMALKDLNKLDEIRPIYIIDAPGESVEELVEKYDVKNQNDEKLEELTKIVYKNEFYKGKLNENCKEFKGLSVKEAKEKVKEILIKENKAFIFYETSRKAVTRSGSKVIVAVLDDQWFLDYSSKDWKEKTHKLIDEMLIYPEKYKKWFHDTVDWLDKRPCARKRGLGTKLPFDEEWVIEPLSDSTIYMAFYTIIHHLRRLNKENLPIEFYDYVFLGKGNIKDVARKTEIPEEEIERMRKEFLYWYPVDLRHTAPAHISNHLTFFLMHHIAIFPEEHWPKAITLNELLIREGVKMSKSKGNVIPLAEVASRYGADLYRLYVIGSADLDAVVDWREKDVSSMQKRLEKFIEYVEAAINYDEDEELSRVDKWFLSRFSKHLKNAKKLYKNFKLRDAIIEIFFEVLNDLQWVKRRGSKPEKLVRIILEPWLIALAPVIPHTAEEYWHLDGNSTFISKETWIDYEFEDEAEDEEEYLKNLIQEIRNIKEISKVEQMEKIVIYTATKRKRELLNAVIEKKHKAFEIAENVEEKQIIARWIKSRIWDKVKSANIDEEKIIEEEKSFIEKEFNAKVLLNPEEDYMNKKEKAMPLKPAFVFL